MLGKNNTTCWLWEHFASHKLLEKISPLNAALAVFFATFGIISLVRIVFEGEFYWSSYAGYWLGDVFGLTLYAFCMSFLCKSLKKYDGFYKKPAWHLAMLTITSTFALLQQYYSLKAGGNVKRFASLPSQWTHVGVTAILGYYMASLLPVIFDKYAVPLWAKRGAFIAILFYIATVMWDIFRGISL